MSVASHAGTGEVAVRPGAWLKRFHPSPRARIRLVCLAHAGGSASAFHALSAHLSPDVEVVAVQYPGRQERFGEQPVADIHALAAEVVTALAADAEAWPFALFGHSMGALVAFETARRLPVPPKALFVSGHQAPDQPCEPIGSQGGVLDDQALLRQLVHLGGTAAEILTEESLLPLILPALRADYAAVHTYTYRPVPALDCAVIALTGDRDPVVTVEQAADWARHTAAAFDLEVFDGGHFYLEPRLTDLVATLRRHLTDLW